MTKIDHKAEVETLLHSGIINNYLAWYLLQLNRSGLNEDLWDEAIRDAELATEMGVDSDADFKTFFYIDHFADDLCKDAGSQIDAEQISQLKQFMFENRHKFDYNSVSGFRNAAAEWLKGKQGVKLAYHNIGKPYKALEQYNTAKWTDLVQRINQAIKMGYGKHEAVREASTELQIPERLDFLEWYKLHSTDETHKYDINEQIKNKSRMTYAQEEKVDITKIAEAADERHYYLPRFRNDTPVFEKPELPGQIVEAPSSDKIKNNEQDAKDFEAARNKLVNRTFSIDKLLEKYKRVLTSEQIDGIEDSLNELRKKIRKLKMATTIKDSLLKTAGILNKLSFKAGAKELTALAEDAMEAPQVEMSAQKKNETLEAALAKLHEVSVALKNRDVIRQIAEADILLNEIRMASFFPEMQEAQAKLIDAFGYASNRIEEVLPKLRGGLPREKAEPVTTPVSKTDDVLNELHQMAKNPDDAEAPPPKAPAPAEEEGEDSDKLKELLLPVRE